jgi:hypothetical protein
LNDGPTILDQTNSSAIFFSKMVSWTKLNAVINEILAAAQKYVHQYEPT